MTKPSLSNLKELLWLAIAFIGAALICYLLLDWDDRGAIITPQRSDTYIILSTTTIVPPVFLLVAFLLFFIKESREKFSRKTPNILLLLIGLGLITLLAFVNKSLVILGTNFGWTAYPPLSMLPDSGPEDAALNPFVASLANALTVLQILVTVSLLYVVFHWGRNTKQND